MKNIKIIVILVVNISYMNLYGSINNQSDLLKAFGLHAIQDRSFREVSDMSKALNYYVVTEGSAVKNTHTIKLAAALNTYCKAVEAGASPQEKKQLASYFNSLNASGFVNTVERVVGPQDSNGPKSSVEGGSVKHLTGKQRRALKRTSGK